MKSPVVHFAVAVVVACIAAGVYYGWYAAVSRKSAYAAELEQQIMTASAEASRIAAARMALAEISGDEKTIQSYFVSDTDVVTFIGALESLGSATGSVVRVLSVSPAGTPARPALHVALTINGTFDAVMRTVGAVEYVPYAVSITTMAVGQDAANKWHADLNLTVGSLSKGASGQTKKP